MKEVIRVRDHAGGRVLSGSRDGAKFLNVLVSLMPPPQLLGGPLFIDFDGVSVATASFLRESVLSFKAFARTSRSSWFPVVANASEAVLEELEVVCDARSDAFVTCELNKGRVTKVRLAGSLESKQREAYEFVTSRGSATAKQLMETMSKNAEISPSPTAWNNRLSVLVEKGLITESSDGRQKLYTPIIEGYSHGH